MTLPGFDAEGSLYRSRSHYCTATINSADTSAASAACFLQTESNISTTGSTEALQLGPGFGGLVGAPLLPWGICQWLAGCCVGGNPVCCILFKRSCLPLWVCPSLSQCCNAGIPLCCAAFWALCICPWLRACCLLTGNPACCRAWGGRC